MADSKKIFGKEVPENLEPITITLDNSGEGDLTVFDSDDITSDVLDKLGDYLSTITKDAGNEPAMKPGSEEVTTTTARGNPAGLTNGPGGAESQYFDTFKSPNSEQATATFEQASKSGLLPFSIRKGRTDDKTLKSGAEVFEDVNANLEKSELTEAVMDVLVANNRYAQDTEYVDPHSHPEEDDSNVGHVILQKKLGEHTPRNFPTVAGDGTDVQFKVKRLKNIGLQMLLEASGEYYVPNDADDFASVVAARAASTAPGLARLGVKIPINRFSAAEIASTVNPQFQKNSNFPDLSGPRRYSHGSYNNPLVPFNAVSSTSATTAAILLTTTLGTLIKLLAFAIGGSSPVPSAPDPRSLGSAFSAGDKPAESNLRSRKMRMGSYLGKAGKSDEPPLVPALSLLGSPRNFFKLQETQNDYGDCVKAGSEIFFGSSPNLLSGLVGAAGAAVGLDFGHYRNVTQNPGYFNVLLRMLVKSTAETVGGAINSVIGLGFNIGGSNAIDSIRDSKILNFMDILAVIGDISISIESDVKTGFDSSIDAVGDKAPGSSDFPNPAALIKKDRLSDSGSPRHQNELAWASNTVRSRYLLPSAHAGLGTSLGFKSPSLNGQEKSEPNVGEQRIGQDEVLAIENELDACYMPFYFHDLRTNEIISFHAFIENISDSFDADYTEAEGYGRIGKIFTYKNTNRSIGCSFRVVSTNKEDFSDMWYKINRLVMLLYPQYTAGRSVSFIGTDGIKKQFIQPFSQLISNSPMIRFRLGDLIKGNYSDIDLARLFGAGTDGFKITSTSDSAKKTIAEQNAILAKISTDKERILRGELRTGDVFYVLNYPNAGSKKKQKSPMQPLKGGKKLPQQLPSEISVVVGEQDPGGKAKTYKVQALGTEGLDEFLLDLNGQSVSNVLKLDLDYMNIEVPKELEKGNDVSGTPDDTNKFFSREENPIFKSFASVAGKGLAGFIRRLTFDWSDARWETEGLNDRAPMWCKIDIDFSPVHDINPGLDSSGAIIGPPYNIGSLLGLMKQRSKSVKDTEELGYMTRKAAAYTPRSSRTDQEDAALAKQLLDKFPS